MAIASTAPATPLHRTRPLRPVDLAPPTGTPVTDAAPALPARDELLAVLRDGSGHRPRFDPALAGGLRAWLEDAAVSVASQRGDSAPPVSFGPRLLWANPRDTTVGGNAGGNVGLVSRPTDDAVRARLVRALFRQVVATGAPGDDPLGDARAALAVDPAAQDLVRHLDTLDDRARAALGAELESHLSHLARLTPHFSAGWLPRTADRVAIPLAGGRVVLLGTFDLLVGAPVPGTAALCALGLATGGRWSQARSALHYLALLETLRSGSPPFRVALLHTGAGRYSTEDVTEEHLRVITAHVAARLTERAGAGGEDAGA
jgi:hypothetical protein